MIHLKIKRCFVISPIGPEESDLRKDADDVFEYIIKPAMEECDIKAVRSDHLDKPGKISEQMFHEIFNADVCIADLTKHNPNVFYELAVAQSANRPVIILIRKGEQLPFDVRDLRSIHYDLNIRSYQERIYIQKIANYIKEFEDLGWKVQDLFSKYRSLTVSSRDVDFFAAAADYGTPNDWLRLLHDTNNSFDIMGVVLQSWRRTSKFEEVIVQKAKEDCKVRILMMHEDHPSLHLTTTDLKLMKDNLPHSYKFFFRLTEQCNNIEVRQITEGVPNISLTITDQHAVMIQYLLSKKWGSGPLIKCTNQSTLYKIFQEEFDTFWNMNSSKHTITT